MSFRSDEDALIAKNEALEGELAAAQREVEALRPQADRASSLERELAEAQRELEAARSPKPVPRTGAIVVISLTGILTVGVLASGVGFFITRTTTEKAETLAHREHDDGQQGRPGELGQLGDISQIVEAPPVAPPLGPPYAELTGRVTAVEGPAPATDGSACTVTIERARRLDARLHVECGGRTVYGREGVGYLDGCTFRGEQPERCEDRGGTKENRDPMVVLDRPTGTLIVSDGPELPWTVEIALDPPAAR